MVAHGTYPRLMPDLTTGFRVLVTGQGQRAQAWATAVRPHGWDVSVTQGDAVREDAQTFWPHAALIETVRAAEAAAAGMAVRSSGSYNAALLFVTNDKTVRDKARGLVPAPTFVTEQTYMGELSEMPAAR